MSYLFLEGAKPHWLCHTWYCRGSNDPLEIDGTYEVNSLNFSEVYTSKRYQNRGMKEVLGALNCFVFFFNVNHFSSLYWICYNSASALYFWVFFCLGFFLWGGGELLVLFWPWGISAPKTRDWTHTPYIRRRRFNHWTPREVPWPQLLRSERCRFHSSQVWDKNQN